MSAKKITSNLILFFVIGILVMINAFTLTKNEIYKNQAQVLIIMKSTGYSNSNRPPVIIENDHSFQSNLTPLKISIKTV